MAKYLDMPGLTYFYNQLKTKFASKTDIGAPLKASTVAGMTNHDRIYIYTGSETGYTSGHWYYYDDGSWVDGGAYNSVAVETDTTLSISDMAADAKVTGDEITDLKSALSSFYNQSAVDYTSINSVPYNITSNGNWAEASGTSQQSSKIIEIPDSVYQIGVTPNANGAIISFLRSISSMGHANAVDFSTVYSSRITLPAGSQETYIYNVPSDAVYFCASYLKSDGTNILPSVTLFQNKIGEIEPNLKYIGVELPSEYKQVLSLKSDGTQRVVLLSLRLNSNSRVVLDFRAIESWNTSGTEWVVGSRYNSSSKQFSFGVSKATNRFISAYGSTYDITTGPAFDTERHILDFNKNNVYLDGENIFTYSAETFSAANVSPSLFALHSEGNSSYYYSSCCIYSAKIYDDGTLVANLIPCIRKSDENPGMYDVLNNIFYSSTNTGSTGLISKEINLVNDANNIDYLDEKITKLESKDYISAECDRLANKIRSVQTGTSISFLAVSDMHYSMDNSIVQYALRDMSQAVSLLSKQIHLDFYASFGDIIYRLSSNGDFEKGKKEAVEMTKLISACFGNNPQIRMVGNHDPNAEGATGYFTESELNTFTGIYNKASSPYYRDSGYENRGYGYWDYEDKKIRFIVLNTSVYGSSGQPTQNSTQYLVGGIQSYWLCKALDLSGKTDTQDWQIIILSHMQLDNINQELVGNRTDVINAYLTGGTWTYSSLGYSYNFSGKNLAKIALMVHGHMHKYNIDNLKYVYDGSVLNVLKIPKLYVPNALPDRDYESIDGETYTKTPNTEESTAFQVITIDYENNIVYAHHYGAGIDIILHYQTTNTTTLTTGLSSPVWASKDTDIATVSNGTITPVSNGFVIIWCKSETENCIEAWNFESSV